ncbi:unannotated protein [freshwater metagenome]|uniref:Unannotated protein n=1 Tax=freshwater metagenome TaxID=449393 RepID=A0A6J5Z1I9_9ZZZZ
MIAVSGDTTESIGAAKNGKSNLYASICHEIDTSCASRVLREGTIAISSNEYAVLARFPAAISISNIWVIVSVIYKVFHLAKRSQAFTPPATPAEFGIILTL